MDEYVFKPSSSQELQPAVGSQGHAPKALVWNMANTLEQLGGDETLLHEVMEIFLDDVPKHMAGLQRSISESDAPGIEQTAHTLKGELGYLGIAEISQKAREMEEAGTNSDLRRAANLYATFERELSELLLTIRKTIGAKSDAAFAAPPGALGT